MNRLILENQNKITYLEEVTYNIERIRTYLKRSLKDFSFISSFDASLLLDNFDNKNFISLDSFEGLIIEEDEMKVRKTLLDLLKLFKNMFKDLFYIETIEAMKKSELEEYSLIMLDEEMNSYEVVTLTLNKVDKIYASFRFNELYNTIYKLISSQKENDIPFDSAYIKIAISLIQKTKNGVVKTSKELIEELKDYKVEVIDEENYIEARSETLKDRIPLIIEIGPSNVRKEELTLISKLGRNQIKRVDVVEEIQKLSKLLNEEYYKKSFRNVLKYQAKCLHLEKLENGNRFCLCEDPNCINKVLDKTSSKTIYHTFSNVRFSKKCIVCAKEAKNIVFTK